MATTEPVSVPPEPAAAPSPTVRQRNGLGVAALVLGVASLVAVASFVLFPLALIGGIVGVILGAIALNRAGRGVSMNRGQAIAGLTCSAVALILAIVLSVRVGTWASDNRKPLGRLESCLTKAGNGTAVGDCFARFAKEITATPR
jgi:membrane-bound ClpP family serine protease